MLAIEGDVNDVAIFQCHIGARLRRIFFLCSTRDDGRGGARIFLSDCRNVRRCNVDAQTIVGIRATVACRIAHAGCNAVSVAMVECQRIGVRQRQAPCIDTPRTGNDGGSVADVVDGDCDGLASFGIGGAADDRARSHRVSR